VRQVGLSLGGSLMRPPRRPRIPGRVVGVLGALLALVPAPSAMGISSGRMDAERVDAVAGDPASVDVAAVDRFLTRQIGAASIPGAAVAITHGDRVIHLAGFGHDSTGAAVTADTLFRVASLSKSFTALAVMQLVDERRLGLDDPVVDHLPEFRIADPRGADITVRQLLEQTSGLTDATVHPLARTQPGSLREAVSSLRGVRLAAEPGTQWNYHNPNYEVASRLVEVVAGEPFAAYLRDHVFRPAGMSSTATVDIDDQPVPGLAKGHVVAWGHAFAAAGPGTFTSGGGGVVSTAADMAKWLIVQTNHGRAADGTRILSDQRLTEQHTAGAVGNGYALGWDTDGPAGSPTRIDHSGNLLTYSAYMQVLPESGYGVVVLLNAGSGLMLDQTGIFYGVRSIVDGSDLTPPGPAGARFNVGVLDTVLGLLTLVVALLGARGARRAGRWARRRRERSWTGTALRLAAYLVLLAGVAAYPQLAERLVGGREVTWEEATYGWPALTVLVWTLLAATLATVGARAWHLAGRRSPASTADRAVTAAS
jgi:CubicO group peptidase (beta-lactamase class C family)